jgi:hypothetical protein
LKKKIKVQCVLTINIFIEKIYIIVWFWYVILAVMTLFDLASFIIKNFLPNQREKYIIKHVKVFTQVPFDDNDSKKYLKVFARDYLKPDVVLVLRILSTNVNGMVVSELVRKLWDIYMNDLVKGDIVDKDSPISKDIDETKPLTEEMKDIPSDNEVFSKFPKRNGDDNNLNLLIDKNNDKIKDPSTQV